MKSFILVHHSFSSDPRVVLVAESLSEQGHDARLIGISDEPSSGRTKFKNLKAATGIQTLRRLPALLVFSVAELGVITFVKSIFVVMIAILFAVVSLPLFLVLRLLKKLYLFFGFSNVRFLQVNIDFLRGLIAPIKYTYEFLKIFATFQSYLLQQEPVDVVHCNDLETLLVGVYLKKKWSCFLVYDAHEYFPQQASWFKGWMEYIFSSYERKLIKYTDANFMVSEPLANMMEKKYELSKKMHIVPNVFSKTDAVKEIHSCGSAPVRFYYMGGFIDERGIKFLIENWKSVNPDNAHLYLRGPKNSYYQQCVDTSKRLGIFNKSVFFLDPVGEEELIPMAKEYDVGVIPYLPINVNNKYCCPNKLSQYMLAGTAILSQNLPNVCQIISKYKNGYSYDYQNPESFIQAVDRLTQLETLNMMKRNSLQASQQDYNWEIQSESFMSVYRELSLKNNDRAISTD
jgi:glycosyltransferase involved in cell wall biosynthesis